MSVGLRNLPPLSTFIALESVVRNVSFTAASRELRVTQAAVSQQVKALEENLGIQLIRRERPRIRPTSEAEMIARAVRFGIDSIEQAVRSVRQRSNANSLSIAAVTALSSFWLMPRLSGFFVKHPTIEVHLVTRDREIQIEDDDFDAGIVFTSRQYPGFEMRRLFGDQLVAVCSPNYLDERPHIRSGKDLARETLLHLVTDDPWMGWPEWFEACGVHVDAGLTGPQFTNYILVVQAALEGRGIALGWRRLVEPMLEGGELVRVTPDVAVPEPAYNLIMPSQRATNTAVRAFRSWLLEEAARDW